MLNFNFNLQRTVLQLYGYDSVTNDHDTRLYSTKDEKKEKITTKTFFNQRFNSSREMQYDLQVSLSFFVFSETKQRVVTNIHMHNHKSKATKMVESESTFGFARAEKLEREMRRWRWNPREGAGMERE